MKPQQWGGARMTADGVRWGIPATGRIAAAFTADLVDLPAAAGP
ncbi:hypothetical protein [Streptomyces sp. NPDC052701]